LKSESKTFGTQKGNLMNVWRVSLADLLQRKRDEVSDIARTTWYIAILLLGGGLLSAAILVPYIYLIVEHPKLCAQLCGAAVLIPCLVWVIRHPLRFLLGLLRMGILLVILALSFLVYFGVIGVTARIFLLGAGLCIALLFCVNYLAICIERKGKNLWWTPIAKILRAESYAYVVLLAIQAGIVVWFVVHFVIAIAMHNFSGNAEHAPRPVPSNAAADGGI
jgi:hypothetical protein